MESIKYRIVVTSALASTPFQIILSTLYTSEGKGSSLLLSKSWDLYGTACSNIEIFLLVGSNLFGVHQCICEIGVGFPA